MTIARPSYFWPFTIKDSATTTSMHVDPVVNVAMMGVPEDIIHPWGRLMLGDIVFKSGLKPLRVDLIHP